MPTETVILPEFPSLDNLIKIHELFPFLNLGKSLDFIYPYPYLGEMNDDAKALISSIFQKFELDCTFNSTTNTTEMEYKLQDIIETDTTDEKIASFCHVDLGHLIRVPLLRGLLPSSKIHQFVETS